MKLIYAIVNDDDAVTVQKQLTKNSFFATKLSSTGGFLMSGNTTFLICTDDEKTDAAINIIKEHSRRRRQYVPAVTAPYADGSVAGLPFEVTVGGATIFVTDIERFEKC
ncbi:MAG: cyclic-di-AMP receptor [Oscillospiraceae bacterium]|jgi:uncharacterized protein YaaQ|nr:cyclic-di-AMP receptor [Oscillospiraceae bacterium]